MPTEKTLSIIIPSYNMEAYLPQCLDSLLGPDVPVELLDIIVVNDGSRDRTSEIAHSYADRDPDSIRVIDKANGNYGSCINAALPTARGRYVKILDADDSFSPDTFPAYVRFLTTATADLVLNDYAVVDTDGKVDHVRRSPIEHAVVLPLEACLKELMVHHMVSMHAYAYRTEIFHRFKYHQTEGISYTDEEWVKIPLIGIKTVQSYCNILYRYLVGREGQTMSKVVQAKSLSQKIQVIKSITGFIDQNINSYRSNIREMMIDMAFGGVIATYQRLLFLSPSKFIETLREFDNFILHTGIIDQQKLSATSTQFLPGLRFNYITYWRNHNYGYYSPLIMIRRILISIRKRF